MRLFCLCCVIASAIQLVDLLNERRSLLQERLNLAAQSHRWNRIKIKRMIKIMNSGAAALRSS